jgi:hypothetical protein
LSVLVYLSLFFFLVGGDLIDARVDTNLSSFLFFFSWFWCYRRISSLGLLGCVYVRIFHSEVLLLHLPIDPFARIVPSVGIIPLVVICIPLTAHIVSERVFSSVPFVAIVLIHRCLLGWQSLPIFS